MSETKKMKSVVRATVSPMHFRRPGQNQNIFCKTPSMTEKDTEKVPPTITKRNHIFGIYYLVTIHTEESFRFEVERILPNLFASVHAVNVDCAQRPLNLSRENA